MENVTSAMTMPLDFSVSRNTLYSPLGESSL